MEIEDLLKGAERNTIDLASCLQGSSLIWSPALYAWQQVSASNEDAPEKDMETICFSMFFGLFIFLTNFILDNCAFIGMYV